LQQAAQGSGGVTIPGGVQNTCRCGTLGHGLVGMVLLGWQLDFMILRGLFQPMILWCCKQSFKSGIFLFYIPATDLKFKGKINEKYVWYLW